jgi:hypothetical protein
MVLVLTTSSIVLAQSADVTYCKALSDKYTRYATNKNGSRGLAPMAGPDLAMANCQSDPAGSIPVLEKALQNSRIDLPPRS